MRKSAAVILVFMFLFVVQSTFNTAAAANNNDDRNVSDSGIMSFRHQHTGTSTKGKKQDKKDKEPAASVTERRQRGKTLKPGDCIGIVAPASGINGYGGYLTEAVKYLKDLGYRVKVADGAKDYVYDYLDGHYLQCALDLTQMFADDDIAAIVCLRGGYGSMCMLDEMGKEDFDIIKKHPKLFIGYSDITALHNVLGERCNLVTIHGAMAVSIGGGGSYFSLEEFEKGIQRTKTQIPESEAWKITSVTYGEAEGLLVGGNLSMIAATCGTPYELKGDSGILVLEETDEDAYRVDRMMRQLYSNGLLKRVNGIAYGEFDNGRNDPGEPPIEEILKYYAELAGKPAIRGIPVGHGENNMFLPLGVKVKISAGKNGEGSLEFLEDYAVEPSKEKHKKEMTSR